MECKNTANCPANRKRYNKALRIKGVFVKPLLLLLTVFLCCVPVVATAAETTYAFSTEEGLLLVLKPADKSIEVELSSNLIDLYGSGWVVCALYSRGKMIDCSMVPINSGSAAHELTYSGERPPKCKIFIVGDDFAPHASAKYCDLYTQAYSVEDGTYAYWTEFSELTNTYNAELLPLQEKLAIAERAKADSEERLVQAKLDLANLPTKENAYVNERTQYYMSNLHLVGSSYMATQKAKQDWKNYYTSEHARLNSTIIIEESNVDECNSTILTNQTDISMLTNEYQNNLVALQRKYPNAQTDKTGGTYETDYYTYEESYRMITDTYTEERNTLQDRIAYLDAQKTLAEERLTGARLDLVNLPTKKTAYVNERTQYYMSNLHLVGSSYMATQMAEQDWDDYYVTKTAEYNSIIISEEFNVSQYEEQIRKEESAVLQCDKDYADDIKKLNLRYGVEQ